MLSFEIVNLSNSDLVSFQVFSASPGLTENCTYGIHCSASSPLQNPPKGVGKSLLYHCMRTRMKFNKNKTKNNYGPRPR